MSKSHIEQYPEQYEHELVGKSVLVKDANVSGTVERVVHTMFGSLVILKEIGASRAFSVRACEEVSHG